MPLIPTELQNGLEKLFSDTSEKTKADAAAAFADAFDAYAKQGLAGAFPFKSPGPAAATQKTLLLAAFNAGNPAVVAQAITAGIVAYWGAALFEFSPAPGIAAPPAGAGALIPALTTVLLNKDNTAASCAAQMATAIDVCCRTVLVTFVPPPPAVPLVLPVV